MFYLYMLVCPEIGEECYVGITRSPKMRLREHLNDCRGNPRNKKCLWILRLASKGLKPEMIILDEIAGKGEAHRSESDAITMIRAIRGSSCLNSGNVG